MAAEVANNQQAAVTTATATEEQTAAADAVVAKAVAAVDETVAAVDETVAKDEQKPDEAAKNNAENHEPVTAVVVAPVAKVVAPKITVHKADFEKDIIYLYQFSRTPLLPSLSPYCLKVETWLRLAGLKYEVSVFALFFLCVGGFSFGWAYRGKKENKKKHFLRHFNRFSLPVHMGRISVD